MCLNTYIHTYIETRACLIEIYKDWHSLLSSHMHTRTHTSIHAYNSYISAYICTQFQNLKFPEFLNFYIFIFPDFPNTYMHTYNHMYIYSYKNSCMSAYIHIYMHATYMYECTHTYMPNTDSQTDTHVCLPKTYIHIYNSYIFS